MREENWRSIGGYAKTSAFIFNKKLLHIVLVILKSDATDVNSLLTLSRPMPSKHSKVWSVFQWYLFQILFWDINLAGKPCLRWEEQQWHHEFSAHPSAGSWILKRIRIHKIYLLLGDGWVNSGKMLLWGSFSFNKMIKVGIWRHVKNMFLIEILTSGSHFFVCSFYSHLVPYKPS